MRIMNSFRYLAANASMALLVAAEPPTEENYHSAMTAAMNRMMAAMHGHSSGDVDRDFVEMMVPHHQGAIDMAVAELRYGSNPQLKRIAQEIVVDQQQEIAAMDAAIGQSPLTEPGPAPTQACSHGSPKAL